MVSLLSSTGQTDLPTLFWQKDGERALSSQQYHRAVADFTQAISISPSDPLNYLKRGISHFELGEYDQSIQDFAQFSSHSPTIETPFLYDFMKGFVKGFPRGVKDSGEGMVFFLHDIATHPIQTAKQLAEGMATLVHLCRNEEYKALFEGLFPEVHTLIAQWEILSPLEKGDLSSYALGKYGADLFGPVLVTKVAQKSVKCAQELASLSKKFKTTQEILLLETSAEMGNSAKLTEIIETAQNTIGMAEELALTTQEIGQLKKAGHLEMTITSKYEHLSLSMQESIQLFREAEKKLKPYKGMYLPEAQIKKLIEATGIPTFPRPKGIPEEYIVKLSDKIGIKYVHPKKEQTYIRVMPGKLHAKYPHQQKPYVVQMKDGKTLNNFGKIVQSDSLEAHIPLEELIYRK